MPGPEDWAARLSSVLTVVYLIYTRGYALGPAKARDLCLEALFLARMLAHLRPDDPEVEGCLALILLTHARAPARIGADGETVPLLDQDMALWDRAMLAEGRAWLDRALARRSPGPFQVKAAIAALHGADGPRDWPQIAALYGTLLLWEPSPIVRLNQAVALAEGQGPRPVWPRWPGLQVTCRNTSRSGPRRPNTSGAQERSIRPALPMTGPLP